MAEVSRRYGDYALVGLVCRVESDGTAITDVALSFFGVESRPVRVAHAEASLIGVTPSEGAFAAAAEIVSASLRPTADVHGSANYRRHLAAVLTRRSLAAATDEIGVPG